MPYSKDVARYLVITFLAFSPISALAEIGGAGPGGGDRCEDRFKVVAKDLETWIKGNGPASLKLDPSITSFDYEQRMLKVISAARVTCVGPGDRGNGYPVTVSGKPKECKNFVDPQGIPRIVCDRAKFYSGSQNPDNDSTQYRIVHHEYASLAKLEVPNVDDSNYAISDQISEYLQDTIVKKLAIKKPVRDELCDEEIAAKRNVYEYAKLQSDMGHALLADTNAAMVSYLTIQYKCHSMPVESFCKEAVPLAESVVKDYTSFVQQGQGNLQTVFAAQDSYFTTRELCR